VQILLESHSEHLLRRLQRRIAEEGIRKDDLGLFFCSAQGGRSHLTELDLDLFGNISNWPEGFFGNELQEIAAMSRAAISRRKK
jgi:predicted ATPase